MNNPHDQHIVGSQHVECVQCGGRDFRLDDGYYYCSECQLQTQEYQAHVMGVEYGGTIAKSKKIKDQNSESGKSASQKDCDSIKGSNSVSSWEILNYALKGLVDELILLGAPKTLKAISLQLWASYLCKTEAAFTSTLLHTKPKFGVFHRRSDAKLFYKTSTSSVKRFPLLMKKRKKKVVDKGEPITARSSKIRLKKDKKALAKTIYHSESIASSSFADSQSSFNLSSLSTSLASLGSQDKFDKLSYSRQGKTDIQTFLEAIGDDKETALRVHKKIAREAKKSVHNATLRIIFAILRTSLLIAGSDIQIGDMRRWMEEGYFSMDRLAKFIPPSVQPAPGQLWLLTQTPFYEQVAEYNAKLVRLLSISDECFSAVNCVRSLVKRYCVVLNLPGTIYAGIDKLLEMKPIKTTLRTPVASNFEAMAMALILFSLKILIGLDDVTEHVYVPRSGTGVRWDEWCKQYVVRMATKAVSHHPSLCRLYPNSYIGRDHSLLSHWDQYETDTHRRTRDRGMDDATKDSIRRVLKPLVCRLPEPSWTPGINVETTGTGPPLAVLREGPTQSGKIPRRVALVHGYKETELTEALDETVRVQLQDGKGDGDGGPSCPIPLFPVDKVKEKKVLKRTTLPDFRVWMYHSVAFYNIRNNKFDRIIQEKLPFSFVWLLGEMSHLIYQPKKLIYVQLMRIEFAFKGNQAKK